MVEEKKEAEVTVEAIRRKNEEACMKEMQAILDKYKCAIIPMLVYNGQNWIGNCSIKSRE